jgi:hypothetical protein
MMLGGPGLYGFGAGGSTGRINNGTNNTGNFAGPNNSGNGGAPCTSNNDAQSGRAGGSGYCLIIWYAA